MTIAPKPSVLLVDDDTQRAAVTRHALAGLDCKPVLWASTARRATRLVATAAPDIFAISARLAGGEDGVAIAQKLRQWYWAPTVFFVDGEDAAAAQRACDVPDATVLPMPFGSCALGVALSQAQAMLAARLTAANP